MALQMSAALRNAMLEQIENIGNNLTVVAGTGGVTGTATAPTLTIFANAIPANTAAADTAASTLAVLNTIPVAFMNAAASGSITLAGTWQDTAADGTGTATHFRMKTSGGVVFLQGTCGQQVVLSTTGATAIGSNVLPMTNTTGIVVGMNITGTNVPPAATVLSISAGVSVTMSIAATAIIASATSCTFTPDLTIDNASIVANQQVTVTAFSVSMQNG